MKTLFAIAVTLVSLNLSVVEAKPFSVFEIQKSGSGQINSNHSNLPLMEISCFGCSSSGTGMPRTNYVRPHINNGRFVGGYWRS